MSWQCPRCDYDNEYANAECEMCDHPRVAGGPQQSQQQINQSSSSNQQKQPIPNNYDVCCINYTTP